MVYIQEQVGQVEHSTVSQPVDLSLCDICVFCNLFIFGDLIVLHHNGTAAIIKLNLFACCAATN